MAIRMTGMMSGLDTESIIQEMVAAKRTKVDKEKKAQTKLEWKQDAWKELNTKLKNFQQKYLSNMRFSDAYTKKTTKVSNSNAVSVITGANAVNGVQNLEVVQLARNAYLTGESIKDSNGESMNLTALSKLSDIDSSITAGGKLKFTANGETKEIAVDENTTISDVLNKLKEAGLNASFDEKWQRLTISSKESGEKNGFTVEAEGSSGLAALKALGLGTTNKIDVKGQDAIIKLNGSEYQNSKNSFEINGLTITALAANPGEEITITTEQDTDGIYDMVKNFLKEYNELIIEMSKLYNADSTKGYEPLTEDEKASMTDSEIEKWESKIKDSILRRDENLSDVTSGLAGIMSAGVTVNGKTMHLFDFGIDVLSYFEASENERYAYHIDGDPDDGYTMNNDDKLKSMIANDPETVISFFTGLSKNLYAKMTDMSKSVNGYRSFGSFYDDKKMKSDYDDYTTKIRELETKLNAYEDKWYKKFSKMETALAKLQSNASAVTGLLGG
ncbi:flagellar filament capping protein FliD [Parablautia muri]|uniref:Flagellar hook-associated protein 2 n=1 Tax=Parablautia muri TaxID=2320879 RepID=A0A9X5BG70_9FIRM|nr:flagellar filament capping protein FliD [Parablautia muri]NBJ92557.1 hypothetical protein [Parablautia muri]